MYELLYFFVQNSPVQCCIKTTFEYNKDILTGMFPVILQYKYKVIIILQDKPSLYISSTKSTRIACQYSEGYEVLAKISVVLFL